jgi:phage gp36-like protein
VAYCTQSDLEIALGGAAVLVQLTDWDDDGVADSAVVNDCLDSGAAEIRPAVEIKHDPETIANLDSSSLRRLLDANAALSARIAWEKGGKGMAMPDWVRDRAERTERFLNDLAEGRRRLGRVAGGTVAAINQPIGVVDYDPCGHGVSISGFRKGFR